MDAIEALTTRSSPPSLREPAPDRAALDTMLAAAMRAPDHGRLRPWRFIVVAGDARHKLGHVLAEALHRREPNAPDAVLAKERAKPLRAPLIVVVAASVRDHPGVPAVEQLIAAGAAAQTILLAAHALGYGGFWRTGKPAYDDHVKAQLGLSLSDAIVAFLYLGTPGAPAAPSERGKPADVAREWDGAHPSRAS